MVRFRQRHVAPILGHASSAYFVSTEPPAGQLRLATPATLNFSVELISSVSTKFRSSLFSTGGDEVNTNCYAQDAQTQADLASSGMSLDEALNNFLLSTHAVVRAQGKTPIVKEGELLIYALGGVAKSVHDRYDTEAQHHVAEYDYCRVSTRVRLFGFNIADI